MSRYFDISLPVENGMAVWPEEPPVEIVARSSLQHGDVANIAALKISSHTGTHIDAPRHFLEFGATVDLEDPDILLGSAKVVYFPGAKMVDRRLLEQISLAGVKRLLLKTDNSRRYRSGIFETGFTALSLDGAEYLIELGIRLVGIDYYSIEAFESTHFEVHKALLGADIVILESINLENVPPGDYDLICLPLKIKNGDGAPAAPCERNRDEARRACNSG